MERDESAEASAAAKNSNCIFFLTFNSKHLIKGTQPRSPTSGAKFDVKGESIDEERNQEESSPREEESCSEEKEVVLAGSLVRVQPIGPEKSGPFLFVLSFFAAGATSFGSPQA